MKLWKILKHWARRGIGNGLLSIARVARIDLLGLAYRQEELGVCDVGEREFLQVVLREILADIMNPVLMDVGANKGGYTAWLLEVFPNAIVHGLEPNPVAFEIYSSRYGDDCRVRPHKIGVSDTAGNDTIYTYADDYASGHASLAASVLKDCGKAVEALTCRLETLDGLVGDKPELGRLTFIKLDIEGAS